MQFPVAGPSSLERTYTASQRMDHIANASASAVYPGSWDRESWTQTAPNEPVPDLDIVHRGSMREMPRPPSNPWGGQYSSLAGPASGSTSRPPPHSEGCGWPLMPCMCFNTNVGS
ncbi:unnamed protein product [Mycena citricolor]|uniref:Uncharacterized protein n=1 Tax=Mycena citricolor TaxID=2018698 RepID=A0AAD2HVF9_9AGAR|nr:unnamed protein product [Mycena citricolor]